MDVIRRMVVLGSLLAVVFGGWGLLSPVSTAPRVVVGPLGMSVPQVEATTVGCGSVLAPEGLSGQNGLRAVVSDTIRALAAQDCPRALREQARSSTTWIGGGLASLLLGLLVLRSPKRDRGRIRSDYIPVATGSGVWGGEPGEIPHSPAHGRRATLAWLGVLAVIVGGVYAVRRVETSTEVTMGSASFAGSAAAEAQRACVTRTQHSDSSLREQAGVQAEADQKEAVLNLDGDAAYVQYAQALAGLNVTDCPTAFQSAFARWSTAWQAYGEYMQEASKFHAPWNTDWSAVAVAAKQADMLTSVERADHDLASASQTVGGDWPARTWSTSG